MARTRGVLAVVAAMLLVLAPAAAANAVTTSASTNEVGGASVAARNDVESLRSAWLAGVASRGGTAQQPVILPAGPIDGVIGTAPDGMTVSVGRTRYSTGPTTTYVGPSPTPGVGACTSNGTGNPGAGMQGGAPRPASLVGGPTCANGYSYTESGGAGENTTRDAVEFTFGRPVLSFGAWFADLETRTDGQGVPALVRLFGAGDVLLSEQQVAPGPNYLPQSNCGGNYTGCGNNTTRWIGFVGDPVTPVTRMVIIVGDDDAGGNASDEGLGFIGPTLDAGVAGIALVKTADPLTDTNGDGLVGPGDVIRYSLLVENAGTLPVTGLAVTDETATGVACPSTTIAVGSSATCTASHTITQADADTGSVSNVAVAAGSVYGGRITTPPSAVTTPIPPVTGLTIEETVDAAAYAAVGDVLTYTIRVSNVGNRTLRGVTVDNPAPGAGAFETDCASVDATLIAGASVTCTGAYAVTQADLDAATVVSTVSTVGASPTGTRVGPQDDQAVSTAQQTLNLTLTKSVDPLLYNAVGQVLGYEIVASNGGNVTLTSLSIADAAPGAGTFTSDCDAVPALLAPGDEASCTAAYTVTQDDIDAGAVANTADASATDPAGAAVAAQPATAQSAAVSSSGLGLVKTVGESTFDAVGDVLTYTVTLSNLGTVTLSGVQVSDPAPGSGAFTTDCAALPATLGAGASRSCSAQYTVTQADIDAGSLTNTAAATGRTPGGATVTSNDAVATSSAVAIDSLALTKTTPATAFSAVGQVIDYTVTATNGGNTTLSGAVIVDPAPGAGAFTTTCGSPVDLAPADVATCTSQYTITQADLDAGGITNTASAAATSTRGEPVSAADAGVTTTAEQLFSLVLAKTASPEAVRSVGELVTYELRMVNAGNVTMTAASIVDLPPGDGAFASTCAPVAAPLAPGDEIACTATYAATQAELDAGIVTNSATGSALDPQRNIRRANVATADVAVQQFPELAFVKTADTESFTAQGDTVGYTMTLTNVGNVTFESYEIADSTPGDGAFTTDCSPQASPLAPGESATCTATYVADAVDLAAGVVVNAASGSAIVVGGADAIPAVTSTVEIRAVPPPDPAPDPAVAPGQALAVSGAGPLLPPLLTGFALILAGGVLFISRRHPPSTQ